MYKKFVASFMTALMAAMALVSPALGATALNTYPTFLGKVGDFYVVVGAKAAASDVAGAIDIAANLAQLSYKDTTVSGTTSSGLTGTERKVILPEASTGGQISGSGANQFPTKLRNFHYSGLKEGQFDYRGTKHNYHEEVELDDTGTALILAHGTGSPINGTLKMRLENNATTYKYVFDDTISSADFSASSANATTYSNPVKAMIAGKEFSIVAVPSATSFISLVGDVKTLSDGESMKTGDLTFKIVQSFASSTAKIEITDSTGNVVKSGINTGSTETVSFGGSTYSYRVLSSGATASGVLGYAQLLAGKGDIEKTFESSTASTITEFGSNWKIGGSFATTGRISSNDYIKVVYDPESLTDDTRYFLPGSTFKGTNNYFELKFAGYSPDKFAKVTIKPVSGQTIYDSTATSGYKTTSGLAGLQFSSDVAGTLVYSSTGYTDMYLLFNASSNSSGFVNTTGHWLGYKDTATGRIVTVANATYPVAGSNPPAADAPNAFALSEAWAITLSYGGPGASQTFTLGGLSGTVEAQVPTFFNVNLNTSTTILATLAFQNKTTPSTSTAPDLRLGGTSGLADASDVQVRIESGLRDVSTQEGTVISDNGTQIYTVKSNAIGEKVVFGIPPETVYGLVQFGKIGAATATTSGTVKEVVAVTTAVAKLDSEVTSTDKTGKSLVLVGGPCVNTLVADLKTAGKFAYGCSDWPASNMGIVEVVDGAFATGKNAVVVAGTRAEDTRLASSVLQSYATKLSSITASKVEVTGTALATATVTAK